MSKGLSLVDFMVSQLEESQVPEFEVPKPHGSYYKLDLSKAYQLLQELEAVEFKLFLFLSLKAWGWDGNLQKSGIGTVKASASYMAKGVNSSEASVNKYVISLTNKNYLSKMSVCFKTGNTYRVSQILWVPNSQAPQILGTLNTETNIEGEFIDKSIFTPEIQVAKDEVPEIQVPEPWTPPTKEYIDKRKELMKRLVLGE